MFVKESLRSIGTLLLAGSVVCVGAPHAVAAPDQAGLEKSIVLLDTTWKGYIYVPPDYDRAGRGYWTKQLTAGSTCTGWFVSGDGEMATAGHCVDPAEGKSLLLKQYLQAQNRPDLLGVAIMNWKVEGTEQGAPVERDVRAIQPQAVNGAVLSSATTVQVVDFRPFKQGDLGLLKVSGLSRNASAMPVAAQSPSVGSQLTSIGFPGTVLDIADQSRIPRPSFKSGTASSQQVSPQGVTMLEVSTDISGGMSGGPTVNAAGQVVGVNSSSALNPATGVTAAGTNFITDTKDLRAFLDSHDVHLGQTASNRSFPIVPVVVGVGLAVLIVVVVAVFLMIRRRKTGKTQPASSGGAGVPPAAPFATDSTETADHGPSSQPYPASGDAPAVSTTQGQVETAHMTPSVQGVHFCPNCGSEHRPDEKYCPNCGHVIS
ncbi:trypsin-like peptidase domain-containing protein, partial [Nocardia vaccinii]|uniref:trypsin-like peptidase domain-containing protein n=1 Tax=Nocardia vaccinii TaxID=1822 RepID=UPI00082C3993